MLSFFKKYIAFILGAFIVITAIYILHLLKVLLIPDDAPLEILFVTLFWWLIVSLPIHHFDLLRKNRKTLYKIIGLILLLVVAISIDGLMDMPDNPITFMLLLSFWLGFTYVITPAFFLKYWKLITLFYGPLFIYFTYLRLFSGDLEAYLKIKQDLPFIFFFIPIPIFFVLWIIEQYKYLQNLKAEKSQAELSLLRSQINPHFFFNTLNNLYALTIKNSEKAPEVILKLSEMMRYTIYEGKKDRVPIKNEIDYLNNYITLHKIRYHNKVDIQFNHNVDSNIEIAPLLFIILLENAFKHGLEKHLEDGFIHIDLNSDSEKIQFIIKNSFDLNQTNEAIGIGLENLKKRLKLIYLSSFKLDICKNNNIHTVDLKILLS